MAEEGTSMEVVPDAIIPTDLNSVTVIEIPTADELHSNESTPSGSKRRRGPQEPKDPNAPKRPHTAYMMFTADVRKDIRDENPDKSVSERAKIISRMWADLDDELKKVYHVKAGDDKERYIQEYMAYQETDSYKEFIRKRFPSLKRPKTDDEKKFTGGAAVVTPVSTPAKEPVSSAPKGPLACQQQFVPGLNIPIFSEEFLKHNRDMEAKLRKLRQSSSNLEDENALLDKHVESMKAAVVRVQNEVKKQDDRNTKLQKHLVMLREILVNMFKDLPIPGSGELPSVDNIEAYMAKLQLAISNNPDKHPDLVGKVAEIAKQLEKQPDSEGLPLLEEVGVANPGEQ